MAKAARKEEPEDTVLPPECRSKVIGHEASISFINELLTQKSLTNGWMICGPAGIGKATFAYQLAKAVLSGNRMGEEQDQTSAQSEKTSRLIEQKAHPDLFVAERQWDEKKQRYATEITIDTIRNLISFMGQTSGGFGRVAIIDSADDLNRNAANALLKVLEEPPANALLLLVANAPGKLLPTVRSRCRRLTLQPLDTPLIAGFLAEEDAAHGEESQKLAELSGGRPGFALSLATGEGTTALPLVEEFLSRTLSRKGVQTIAQKLSPAAAEPLWQTFVEILLQYLTSSARLNATDAQAAVPLKGLGAIPADRLVKAWAELRDLATTGNALNTDRAQTTLAMATRMQQIVAGK